MKILVCISKTPDTTAKIAFTDNNTKFAEAGVQFILNPYDEWYALVRAIELKEADSSVQIHLVNVGGAANDPVIRKSLALGGDEAIRVNADSQDSFFIASQIAEVARQNSYDLIFIICNVTLFFIVGIIQALTQPKEKDWMERVENKE